MKRWLLAGSIVVTSSVLGYGQAPAPARQRALLDQYCVNCHNDRAKTANLSLQNLDLATVGDNAELWEKVIRKMRSGVMPPPGVRRPAVADYDALRDWLEAEIDRKARQSPGTKLIHRLNRTEYANAIRDLLDLEIDAEALLPPDDSARGFDNIAGSLTISPTLLEAYVSAAQRIARMAVGYWKTPMEATYIAPGDTSQTQQLEGLPFGTRGGMLVRHNFPADGEYRFSINNFRLGSTIAGEQIELSIDGERVRLFDGGRLEVAVNVKAGARMVGATYLATNYRPGLSMIREHGRKSLENEAIPQLQTHPAIGVLKIQGPFQAVRPTDSRSIRKVFTCRPAGNSSSSRPVGPTLKEEKACAEEILSTLARRAYRRPITPEDLEVLTGFYDDGRRGGTFEDGIELGLRRILASPQFLGRTEKEPGGIAIGQTYRINDLELASRLSFFLWSSIPDDELIDLASRGRLNNPTVLEQQVRRMLADPRSEALVENFAAQWLHLRNLSKTAPHGRFFPDWDDDLRQSFRRETELLFESIMREDRNIVDLLTADFTFINERLARHYGIPKIYGAHFRRVTLGPELESRRGLLGHGSFLSVTWTENFRTSPVKRGVWILENILGARPPDPPPNVPPLEDAAAGRTTPLTLREQMTLHRSVDPCKSCHAIMDPIGFALENFDASGKWRNTDGSGLPGGWVPGGNGGTPIDASGELYDGAPIDGPAGLRRALLRYSPQFVRMFTEKMMTYGLGRGVEYFDMPVIRSIAGDAERNNNRFSAIVLGIVKSAPFQMRTKEEVQ
jgi:hypothetical protein